ncbi:MAG: hypothetical protein IPN79_15855 [Saprospiraceae bacterium]|nr:hypothetical protein [Saprospiraceae bacterium]
MTPNNSFDSRVKEKLGEISTSPAYGSWDSFQKKWVDALSKEDLPADRQFDGSVKEKLTQIQRFHTRGHWEKLKFRLETIEIYKRKIWIHKSKEVLAVLLFLFTFYNVNEHIQKKDHSSEHMYASLTQSVNNTQKQFTLFKHEVDGKDQLIREVIASFYRPNVTDHIVESEDIRGNTLQITSGLITHNPSFSAHESEIRSSGIVGPVLSESKNEEIVDVKALNTLSTEPYSEYPLVMPMELSSRERKDIQTRVGLFVGYSNNFVLTPFDKVYSLPKFSRAVSNFEYGMTVGKKMNRVEIESGISYANLKYSPAKVSETFGASGVIYFETSLTEMEYDFIRLPLNFQYYAIDNKNWKLYFSAGSSINLIAQSDYTIEEKVKKGEIQSMPRNPNQEPRLDDKPFSTGFLDDFTFIRNYYIDMKIGLGAERRINNFCSFYLQQSYHAFLFSSGLGIGPNQDKINALAFQSGIKFNLPSKIRK